MGVRFHPHRNASIRRTRVGVLALVCLTAIAATQALAEPTPNVPPMIAGKPTEIENATNIKAQPLALLAKFPDAGPAMARFVAEQLTKNPGSIDAMLSIINDTSPQQASAIGAGMVRAVRALTPKQASAARDITQKVMRSDNKWLTTTFAALGPSYRPNIPSNIPGSLPPREIIALNEIGFGMGGAWRVGPAENDTFTAYGAGGRATGFANGGAGDNQQKCGKLSNIYALGDCRGMIVAIIASDAAHNGAVSISPTI